jgi:hypothetical protein
MPIEIDNKDLIDDMTVEDIYKRAKVILAKIR